VLIVAPLLFFARLSAGQQEKPVVPPTTQNNATGQATPSQNGETPPPEPVHTVSFLKILKNHGGNLTVQEKGLISLDLMDSILEIQKENKAEHGLSARDFVVRIGKGKPGHRYINAKVIPHAKNMPTRFVAKNELRMNSQFASPESILHPDLHGLKASISDQFSIGCMFWELFLKEQAPFTKPGYFRREKSKKQFYYQKVYFTNAIISQYRRKQAQWLKHKKTERLGQLFGQVLQMVNPISSKRPTADVTYAALHLIVKGVLPPDEPSEDPSSIQTVSPAPTTQS
jgi:hypothetical protein